jgi:uncharacterized membrane protein
MSTPASVKGHPIHPILVTIPIGLFVFAGVADLIHHAGWGGSTWKALAFYTIAGGCIGAVVAAVPGFIDFTSITDATVRRIAVTHMAVNLGAVALFAVSLWLRTGNPVGGGPALVSGAGLALLLAGGWLGGKMVFEHGMGVQSPRERAEASRAPRRRIA